MLQINIFYKSLMNFGLKRIFWRLLGVFKKFLNGQKISKRHWTPHLMKNQIENFQELTDLSTKSSKRHPTKVILNLYQPIDAAVHRNVHFWCSAQNLEGFLLKIFLFHILLNFFQISDQRRCRENSIYEWNFKFGTLIQGAGYKSSQKIAVRS